ncbi:50S ribosomal protein L6 [Candidatus Babeliales bacterium]|nr:50S ribosomal protein L6 [Candidatus Babeliales bacterium]
MSKIGRKPINIGDTAVEVKGQGVAYKGKHGTGSYVVPEEFEVALVSKALVVKPRAKKISHKLNAAWGLHRALLANKIHGVSIPFEKKIQINGLGYKAALSGNKLILTLGFSHKIELDVPNGISCDIDKTGQNIVVRALDKEAVGAMCDTIRDCRPPEPYKGTGIKLADETIIRKTGKAKSA